MAKGFVNAAILNMSRLLPVFVWYLIGVLSYFGVCFVLKHKMNVGKFVISGVLGPLTFVILVIVAIYVLFDEKFRKEM